MVFGGKRLYIELMSPIALNKYIDHTLLKPTATEADFRQLIDEAITHDFYSVCLPPQWVSLASRELKSSDVKVCTVAGFPLGYTVTSSKIFEADRSIELGAHEIDMVANISLLKSKNYKACEDDIYEVVKVSAGHIVKVILEVCYLERSEVVDLCKICESAGAQFVKTSTGFGTGGATVDMVKLMRESVSDKISIKASGGIKDAITAKRMIAAGASRLGTSQSLAIIANAVQEKDNSY